MIGRGEGSNATALHSSNNVQKCLFVFYFTQNFLYDDIDGWAHNAIDAVVLISKLNQEHWVCILTFQTLIKWPMVFCLMTTASHAVALHLEVDF